MAKKKRDFSQVALGIVERLTGGKLVDKPDASPPEPAKPEREKNEAAVALSKLGAEQWRDGAGQEIIGQTAEGDRAEGRQEKVAQVID